MQPRIVFPIGNRANYGSLRSAMLACRRRGATVLPVLYASALDERYGNVRQALARDDFNDVPGMHCHTDNAMAATTGSALVQWAAVLPTLKADTIVVVGDRHEQMAPAIAAAYQGVRTCHVMGGETSGNVDDRVRDAITAFAGEEGVHCVATKNAGDRVAKLINVTFWKEHEASSPIRQTGCPRIDTVREAIGDIPLDPRPMILVSQHPVTTSWQHSHAEMTATLQAVERVAQRHRLQVELFWPNADAGTNGTHQAIRDWLNSDGGNSVTVRTHRAMGPHEYARMMAACRVMVGNSSSALRDGAWIGTPAVNVGDRQRGREHGANVVDVGCNIAEMAQSMDAIEEALERQAEHGAYACSTLYGDGTAGERVAEAVLQ